MGRFPTILAGIGVVLVAGLLSLVWPANRATSGWADLSGLFGAGGGLPGEQRGDAEVPPRSGYLARYRWLNRKKASRRSGQRPKKGRSIYLSYH
ncbi:hypothetical protein [Spirosoma oryzicola]|uniref:hypothetical protein n=1 Tax=Spirosoma oryzicola TaxID=2898794 RepID=UPI001E49EE51|nr:hypothetical protein [Spirosoma oryzicola]UHG93306.1 hypothetical protein LQ777_10480 [Spirosoma oryzicola]